jgi:hypothetical protein
VAEQQARPVNEIVPVAKGAESVGEEHAEIWLLRDSCENGFTTEAQSAPSSENFWFFRLLCG